MPGPCCPQDDNFIPTMSGQETLSFHAGVLLGDGWTREARMDRVSEVLSVVGLGHAAGTLVSPREKLGTYFIPACWAPGHVATGISDEQWAACIIMIIKVTIINQHVTRFHHGKPELHGGNKLTSLHATPTH